MSNAASAVLQARVFDGSREEVRNVRVFVGQAVDGCPVADDVVLLSSELATNAVLHSASGGGTFRVSVIAGSGRVRVEVHDLGSATLPTLRRSRQPGESGAGLSLVDALAGRWGFHDWTRGRVVWFEMDWQ